jgi:hypothetical protein
MRFGGWATGDRLRHRHLNKVAERGFDEGNSVQLAPHYPLKSPITFLLLVKA